MKQEPGNYRPVSLTSVPCEVLESLIRASEKANTDSCQDTHMQQNLIYFLNRLTEARDRGKAVNIIYLDLILAYDKVPHLLKKMEAKGMSRDLMQWVADWLRQRTQKVKIHWEYSKVGSVNLGYLKILCWARPMSFQHHH